MKATRTCSVEDCDELAKSRGWCSAHYQRWRRAGDPTGRGGPLRAKIPEWCTVESCDRPHEAYGMCGSHRRMVRQGRPVGPIESRGGNVESYVGAHQRLYAKFGPAVEYGCSHCSAQAAEWAYDHLDPDERIGTSAGRPVPFSLDLDHYFPLCKSCHAHFDRGRSRDGGGRAPEVAGANRTAAVDQAAP